MNTLRDKEMIRILKIGKDEWNRNKEYNRHWKMECTISDDKRLFRDTLNSRKLGAKDRRQS